MHHPSSSLGNRRVVTWGYLLRFSASFQAEQRCLQIADGLCLIGIHLVNMRPTRGPDLSRFIL